MANAHARQQSSSQAAAELIQTEYRVLVVPADLIISEFQSITTHAIARHVLSSIVRHLFSFSLNFITNWHSRNYLNYLTINALNRIMYLFLAFTLTAFTAYKYYMPVPAHWTRGATFDAAIVNFLAACLLASGRIKVKDVPDSLLANPAGDGAGTGFCSFVRI